MDDRELEAKIEEIRKSEYVAKQQIMLRGARSWAATVWLLLGAYFSVVAHRFSIVSWVSLVYFFPGTTAAFFLFGQLQHSMDKALSLMFPKYPSPAQGRAIFALSLFNAMVIAVLLFLVFEWALKFAS